MFNVNEFLVGLQKLQRRANEKKNLFRVEGFVFLFVLWQY